MALTVNEYYNGFAWVSNVLTSVLIVFVNKVSMTTYGFAFATTLSALHFLSAAATMATSESCGISEAKPLPLKTNLAFAVVANISIASLNLSLMVNTVGFYQIAKLLTIPCVGVLEMVFYKRYPSALSNLAMLVVMVGVALVTVHDVGVSFLGLIIAIISVVSSSFQQVLCGEIQREHKLASYQLLARTALVQGIMLAAVGPFLDFYVTDKNLFDYKPTLIAMIWVGSSCLVSVAVNISQFMCLGRFSALTFQVLGPTKTILVLLISHSYLHEAFPPRKMQGIIIAIVGMVGYAWISTQKPAPVPVTEKEKLGSEVEPLLPTSKKHVAQA